MAQRNSNDTEQWMALVRHDGDKRADWEIVASNTSREAAVQTAGDRCKALGIDYVWGNTFDDGEQQLCYADGYAGSPILGKVVHQTDDRDVIHSVPWHWGV